MLVVSTEAANTSVNCIARRDDLACDEVNIYVVASPQCVIKGVCNIGSDDSFTNLVLLPVKFVYPRPQRDEYVCYHAFYHAFEHG